jgi:phospholipid transport system substrate-binding protein
MMSFLVDQEIAPLFDFDYIASEVLSASYISLSKEESVYFSNTLKKIIINTLLTKLAQGRSSSLNFISARPLRG